MRAAPPTPRARPCAPPCRSQQTPAKPRGGEAEGEGPPFANILALADIKATPVKAEADAEGLGSYRGSETPFGLRVRSSGC